MDIKRIAIFILIGGALAIVLFLRFGQDQADTQVLKDKIDVKYDSFIISGDKTIPVTIADTDEERQKGLSNTQFLEKGTGKLFIFQESGLYGFWMKDMNYPIDMVWIDENFKIVGVTENVDPSSYPKAFYPPRKIKYVLEVNAFEAKELSLIPNTTIFLKNEF